MSEITLNVQPMWNPTSGRSLERILRTQGINFKEPPMQVIKSIVPYIEEAPSFEGNFIYMEMPLDKDNLKQRLKVTGLYIFIRNGTSATHLTCSNAAIAGYLFQENGWEDKRIKIISSITAEEDSSRNIGASWNYEIQKYDLTTGTWVTTFETPWPYYGSYDTIDFHFQYAANVRSYTMNINMPYIPIFATQALAESYLNNPFDPYIYKQALNYYDPMKYSQPVNKEKYRYEALPDLVKTYAELANSKETYSSSLYIENILTPINALLAGYKNISYEDKINKLKEKISQNLVNINDYKTMELIEAPTTTQGQVVWSQKAPFTPVRTFSPFTKENLNFLVNWAQDYCTEHDYKPSENYPYFLMIQSSEIIDGEKYYTIRMLQARCTGKIDEMGHVKIGIGSDNTNIVVQNNEYYFLHYNENTKILYTDQYFANNVTFKYCPSDDSVSNVTRWGRNVFDMSHTNVIILDTFNERVPFYSSHDFYAVDDKNQVYKWLTKTESDTVSRNSVVAADIIPSGMIHIKPILLLFNRYEMSYVNGWDGNKVKVADGYIMAPRMGAGQKEDDNSFTGVIMGVKQQNVDSKENQRIGLFGFNHGEQSMFLNSRDGSAIFGLSGSGQITIDPSTKKGLLYSGNYWKDYNSSDGKPKNYSKSNENGAGMLIDLTTPEIKFGSGKFLVTSEGEMTAQGGGHIARWDITGYTIESNVTANQGKLVLHSGIYEDDNGNTQYGYGYIYSGHHSYFGSYSKGFYLSHAGLSVCNGNRSRLELSTDGDPVIYSGSHSTIDSSVQGFYLGQDGLSISGRYYDNATDPNHEHPITSRIAIRTDSNPMIYSGGHSTLSSSSKGFYLSQDGLSISNGSTSRLTFSTDGDPVIYSGGHSTLASTSNGFYLGNDGLSIGNGFKINATGVFYLGYNATTFDCSNLDQPKTFRIGGAANSIYMGVEGFRLGNKTAVDNNGNFVTEHLIIKNTASDYDTMCWIGNWQFTNENFGAVYKVSNSQWNRLWMSAHGLIQAEQWNREPAPDGVPGTDYNIVWALNTDGTATFTNLDATIPSGKSLSVGGSLTVTGTATISGSLTAGGVTLNNNGITAKEGTIGGFSIGNGYIGTSGSTAYLNGTTVGGDTGRFSSVYATTFYVGGASSGTDISTIYATKGRHYGTCNLTTGQVTIDL